MAAISEISPLIQEHIRKKVGISSAEMNGYSSSDLDTIVTQLKAGPARSKYKVGGYYGGEGVISTLALTDDTLVVGPVVIDKLITVEEIGVDVTSAGTGGNLYVAVYYDRGDGYPGALMYKTGALAVTGAFQSATGLTLRFAPGIYWMGAHNSGAVTGTATVRALASSSRWVPLAAGGDDTDSCGYSYTEAADSVPLDPFTSTMTVVGKVPRVLFKVKQA